MRNFGRLLLSFGMVTMGVLHLGLPGPFLRIMPSYLPEPAVLVLLSGIAEIGLGIGLLIPQLRRLSSGGLIALFLAVFPANIEMALHPPPSLPPWLLWLRLPFQIPLIYWAYGAGKPLAQVRPEHLSKAEDGVEKHQA